MCEVNTACIKYTLQPSQTREVLHPSSTFSRAHPKMMCMFARDQDSECVPGTHTFSFHDLLVVAQFFALFLSFEKEK
jgi:hypothetical protein